MDDTGDVTENGQEDVDEEVGTTATLEEHTKRRKDDGDNDLDDVAADVSVTSRFLPFRRVHSAGRVVIRRTYDPVKGMLAVFLVY